MVERKLYTEAEKPPSNPLVCAEKGKTRQSEKDSCDVNKIMERYEKTGIIPSAQEDMFYADVSQVGDYRDALERVEMANEYFMRLPARIREKFDNEPAAFLDFCSDPANKGELQELGLIERDEEALEAPAPVPEPPEAA